MSYQQKYLKYKSKYLNLKKLLGGNPECDTIGIKTKIKMGIELAGVIKNGCKIGEFVAGNQKDNENLAEKIKNLLSGSEINILDFLRAYGADDFVNYIKPKIDYRSFMITQKKLILSDPARNQPIFEKFNFDDLYKIFPLEYILEITASLFQSDIERKLKQLSGSILVYNTREPNPIKFSEYFAARDTAFRNSKIGELSSNIKLLDTFHNALFNKNRDGKYDSFEKLLDDQLDKLYGYIHIFFNRYWKHTEKKDIDNVRIFDEYLLNLLLSKNLKKDDIAKSFLLSFSLTADIESSKENIMAAFKIIYPNYDESLLKQKIYEIALSLIIINDNRYGTSNTNIRENLKKYMNVEEFIKEQMEKNDNRIENYKKFRKYANLVTADEESWAKFMYSIVPSLSLVYEDKENLKYLRNEIQTSQTFDSIRVLNKEKTIYDKQLDNIEKQLIQRRFPDKSKDFI